MFSPQIRVLIIDDSAIARNTLSRILETDPEIEVVGTAPDALIGLKKIAECSPDVLTLDVEMPKMDGLEVLEKAVDLGVDTPIVMISGHGTIETAVEALKKGAYDFIAKPLDLNRLLVTVRNALDRKELVQETKKLKRKEL